MPFFLCVTVMFRNPADGPCADRACGAHGAARRCRDRRLRTFLKHEHMTVAMNLSTVQHHSFKKSAVMEFGVQVGSHLRFAYDLSPTQKSVNASDETSSVTEYVPPAPTVTVTPPAPEIDFVVSTPAAVLVIEYVTPALVPVTDYATPTHAIEYVAPASVTDYIATPSAATGIFVSPQFSYLCCGGLSLTSRWFCSFRC